MSTNRLDNRIKEILKQRTLTPSKNAWQAVEEQLDPPVPASRPGAAWYAIAAGFIGILWVTVLITDGKPDMELPVENTVRTEAGSEDMDIRGQDQDSPSLPDALVALPVPENSDRQVYDRSSAEELPSEKEIKILEEKGVTERMWAPGNLDLKVSEVVAQVALLEDLGFAVEERVIDSLLIAAREQVWKEQILKADQRVDAMALLSDVEGELNRSLRDQLFEKLKEGYLKVRDAVAYRNE